METVTDLVIRAAALLLLALLLTLWPKFRALLDVKLDEAAAAELDKLIDELTRAAEQMLKQDDPDGSKRLQYVQGMLIEAGYDLTDAIRAKIESRVFGINEKGDEAA